jgi:hypothetical protein
MRLKPSVHKHTDGRSYKYPSLAIWLCLVWLVEVSRLSCDVALVRRASVIRGVGIGS